MLILTLLVAGICGLGYSAPFYGTMTAVNGDHRETVRLPRSSSFVGSLGETIVADPEFSRNKQVYNDLNMRNDEDSIHNDMKHNDGVLVRKRRLADDKRLDLKMKMQRVKKVVSLDAIGSYSIFRSDDRKTSLKAFGSTELWYDGVGFGLKKPGLGVQFTIYY